MDQVSSGMEACIEACQRCSAICLGTAMQHCLEQGGRHVEPAHFRLMMACAEICRSSAAFLLIGTEHHRNLCAECAGICDECAASCREIGGMQACVEACARCAEECRRMAG